MNKALEEIAFMLRHCSNRLSDLTSRCKDHDLEFIVRKHVIALINLDCNIQTLASCVATNTPVTGINFKTVNITKQGDFGNDKDNPPEPLSPFEKLKATFDELDISYLVETTVSDFGERYDNLYIVSEEEKSAGVRETKFFSDHQLFEFLNGEVASY